MPDRVLDIMRDGGRLFVQVTAAGGKPLAWPVFEMFAEGRDIFFVKVIGGTISLKLAAMGEPPA